MYDFVYITHYYRRKKICITAEPAVGEGVFTTGMTGGQDSAAFGHLVKICEGIGVDPAHIRLMVPLKKNLAENVAIMREEMEYKGVSVIIPQRECIQTYERRQRAKKAAEKKAAAEKEACGCTECGK